MPQVPDRTIWVQSECKDPIDLVVNSVRSTVTFSYDNDAGVVFYQSGVCKANWLWATAWRRDRDYATCSWYYSDSRSKVTVDASEHFTNPVFCSERTGYPGTDHVYHDNVIVTGNSDGSADVTISGPCDELLDTELICSWGDC